MNIKEIKEMINLMNDNGLVELEIEKEGMRIRLKKTSSGTEFMQSPIVVTQEKMISEARDRDNESAQAKDAAQAKTAEIKAPMVGTFYRAPAPEAPPYAEVGQVVDVGQVICIIEAMKLMNEIKAEVKGKILEILVDNAEPVEFGQPMFLIEPL
jgi:oxaloacetate decarboxylase alpha subunit